MNFLFSILLHTLVKLLSALIFFKQNDIEGSSLTHCTCHFVEETGTVAEVWKILDLRYFRLEKTVFLLN